ncbi:MAG: sigma-54 dependent transcriptional regulator [Candidatus Eisenbacteria bacterium]
MHRVLVVEDQETLRQGILEVLSDLPLRLEGVASAALARQHLTSDAYAIVLTDLRLESPEAGLDLVREIAGRSPRTEVMLMTAFATVEVAVEAMKAGAFDFLVKPFSMEQLRQKFTRLIALLDARASLDRERERNELLRDEIMQSWGGGELIGQSPGMLSLFRQIEKVADSNSSVLILGESGTGKELVARALHERSVRRDRPFVRVHCGALAEGVLESELFGHEKGAFTGAVRQHRGRFELADGGTILLDEIGEVSPAVQVKLLRVLQERQLERVGGEEPITVDVRVIAATHRDLEVMVKVGRFRQDLYYRLFVIPLRLPPLRERAEDIPLLAQHFSASSSQGAGAAAGHDRGRGTELARSLSLARQRARARERDRARASAGGWRSDHRAGSAVRTGGGARGATAGGAPALREVVEQVERQLIERALRSARGNKSEAARLLDLKASVLYYKLEKYGLIDRIEE